MKLKAYISKSTFGEKRSQNRYCRKSKRRLKTRIRRRALSVWWSWGLRIFLICLVGMATSFIRRVCSNGSRVKTAARCAKTTPATPQCVRTPTTHTGPATPRTTPSSPPTSTPHPTKHKKTSPSTKRQNTNKKNLIIFKVKETDHKMTSWISRLSIGTTIVTLSRIATRNSTSLKTHKIGRTRLRLDN